MGWEHSLITHEDGIDRCGWSGTAPDYVAYHDEEWGVPEYDSRALFEKLLLDGFQAGLSWIAILRKRDNFRAAFDNFDPTAMARYDAAKKAELMQDAGIVRNRLKDRVQCDQCASLPGYRGGAGLRHLFVGLHGWHAPGQPASAGWKMYPAATPLAGKNLQGPEEARLPASSARPSSMPSCRRSAWSTTIWFSATGTNRARNWRARALSPVSKKSEAPRAWQRMLSGRRLDLLEPSPLDVEIEDIAHGLARVARWNGQTHGAHAFSVAQHCVLVEQLLVEFYPSTDQRWRLAALLHDASEYVIGDMISPFKAALGLGLQGI